MTTVHTRRQVTGLTAAAGAVVVASLAFSPAAVLGRLQQLAAHPLAFAGALAALYLLRPLLAWPITPVSVLVGYVYGVELGLPIALVGAVFTCLPPFGVARWFETDVGLLGNLRRSGRQFFDVAGTTRGVLAARLVPVPADVVSYGAGLSGVGAAPFVLGTTLGEVPWTVAAVLAGSSMQTLAVDGIAAAGPSLVVAAAVAGLLLVAGPTRDHLGA